MSAIKKTIAREGLILLGLIATGTFVYLGVAWNKDHPWMTHDEWWRSVTFGFFVLPFYSIYLLVRFVSWAIKTLRK